MTAVNFKDTNVTTGYFVLDNLEKFTWYTVWVKSDTSRGLGVESERFRIRTLEEGMLMINADNVIKFLFSAIRLPQFMVFLYDASLFVFFMSVGSVVPINATVRLPDEEWRDDLSNTTSEAFMNLSRKLEINVSVHAVTMLLISSVFNFLFGFTLLTDQTEQCNEQTNRDGAVVGELVSR